MPTRVLVTGGAGFIGSNLCEKLIAQPGIELIRVIDNLETGSKDNVEPFLKDKRFEFIEADTRDYSVCLKSSKDVNIVFHQAALGSVPRSVVDPINTNDFNVTGTLNIFFAAKENKVKRMVFASSSSTYGSNSELPKTEDRIGDPLSPYAVTKLIGELYAKVFSNLYDFHFIGFRYFNVFGPRQSPKGSYAAVVPLFFKEMMQGRSPVINGNGEQSRDFTYVDNVTDINVSTLFNNNPETWNQLYNAACGYKTSLNDLYKTIAKLVGYKGDPIQGPERKGEILDSLADISKAVRFLGYHPRFPVKEGLQETFNWYQNNPSFLIE
jgi:UDP-N-acetylglucosamine/UDP-N-acetylgalactosamine 4-epimerase